MAVVCGLAATAQAGPWADRVVYGVLDGEPVYQPGVGDAITFGPFHLDALWNDPESVVGKPNTLDFDDLEGWGPVPGGFAGGPMRRLTLVYSAWQYGSNDPDDLGQRPGWLDGRRKNGLGLRPGSQVVVEFDEPIENNPDDGGAYHWGVDFIVHGNALFAADRVIAAGTSMSSPLLTGGVLSEPVEVSVAQEIIGPWYTFERSADGLFPTQPWVWDDDWTGEEQDWLKPVDPSLGPADFAGLTAARAIDLYAGSAGGTPFDLDELADDDGDPVSLGWIRYVRLRDPLGAQGEICGIVDVPPGPPGCNAADLAEPFGLLDLADISAFIGAFAAGEVAADLAEPFGILDLADISAFVAAFSGDCP
ncbi:MAG: hypothetical protein H6810_11780 [Phycisphaeraceae bacterium]|nr:MAG: hypothetical protein H6810_11780 [Phycisphaeraceae bacterium]